MSGTLWGLGACGGQLRTSILRSARKAGLFWMASPMSCADLACVCGEVATGPDKGAAEFVSDEQLGMQWTYQLASLPNVGWNCGL